MIQVNDICKEVLIILSYFNDDLIKKIPTRVFKKLSELSVGSKIELYIDTEKDLDKQNISEESKDLISLIYYNFIADENEKNRLMKLWNDNENIYQEKLMEKYNVDNIFQNKTQESKSLEKTHLPNTAMTKYKKETLFYKIKNFIKYILNKN